MYTRNRVLISYAQLGADDHPRLVTREKPFRELQQTFQL